MGGKGVVVGEGRGRTSDGQKRKVWQKRQDSASKGGGPKSQGGRPAGPGKGRGAPGPARNPTGPGGFGGRGGKNSGGAAAQTPGKNQPPRSQRGPKTGMRRRRSTNTGARGQYGAQRPPGRDGGQKNPPASKPRDGREAKGQTRAGAGTPQAHGANGQGPRGFSVAGGDGPAPDATGAGAAFWGSPGRELKQGFPRKLFLPYPHTRGKRRKKTGVVRNKGNESLYHARHGDKNNPKSAKG